jgi:V8-like Glu-specific endopeptidase
MKRFSHQGTGTLPQGRPVTEAELEVLLQLPAARDLRADELDLADLGFEDFALEAQPVNVDITRFPFRAVVYLDIFFEHAERRGTAFFISNHTLATAGHNLLNDFGDLDHVDVIVDVDGSLVSGTTRYTAADSRPHPEYFLGHRPRDFGIIRLNENVGGAVGFFDLADDASIGTTVHVTGYPDMSFFQEASRGAVRDMGSARVFHDAVTATGHSGGPLYIPNSDPTQIVAVGVHTHGLLTGQPFRSGVRMNSDVRSWLLAF